MFFEYYITRHSTANIVPIPVPPTFAMSHNFFATLLTVMVIMDNKVIEPVESYTLNGKRIATINPTILMNAESIDCPSDILAE